MVVLVNGITFALVYLFNPRRGVVTARLRRRRPSPAGAVAP